VRTFRDNHGKDLVSVDSFTVPNVIFHVLFVFVVSAHDRRCIQSVSATTNPSQAWTIPAGPPLRRQTALPARVERL
jgi:hypothetical protein